MRLGVTEHVSSHPGCEMMRAFFSPAIRLDKHNTRYTISESYPWHMSWCFSLHLETPHWAMFCVTPGGLDRRAFVQWLGLHNLPPICLPNLPISWFVCWDASGIFGSLSWAAMLTRLYLLALVASPGAHLRSNALQHKHWCIAAKYLKYLQSWIFTWQVMETRALDRAYHQSKVAKWNTLNGQTNFLIAVCTSCAGFANLGPPLTRFVSLEDWWSCGCITAEMMLGKPLFTGESSWGQMYVPWLWLKCRDDLAEYMNFVNFLLSYHSYLSISLRHITYHHRYRYIIYTSYMRLSHIKRWPALTSIMIMAIMQGLFHGSICPVPVFSGDHPGFGNPLSWPAAGHAGIGLAEVWVMVFVICAWLSRLSKLSKGSRSCVTDFWS